MSITAVEESTQFAGLDCPQWLVICGLIKLHTDQLENGALGEQKTRKAIRGREKFTSEWLTLIPSSTMMSESLAW